MYGLVNRAIHELVTEAFGASTWEAVCAEVGIDPVGFVAMDNYPDKLTYDLVGAVSRRTGMEPSAVLEAFGKYWVEYTGVQGYGSLMAAQRIQPDRSCGCGPDLRAGRAPPLARKC